ncbi:MAG: outer membrane beta-barrel protein [Bacteroidales bacterium]
MKKIGLLVLLILVCIQIQAQEKNVIGKYNKEKNIKITYIPGAKGDIISSILYEGTELKEKLNKLTTLESEKVKLKNSNDQLLIEKTNLQNEIKLLKRPIVGGNNNDSLNLIITKKEAEYKLLISENEKNIKEINTKEVEIKRLRDELNNNINPGTTTIKEKEKEIERLKKELEIRRVNPIKPNSEIDDYKKSKASVGFTIGSGKPYLSGDLINNSIWQENNPLSKEFCISYETSQLSTSSPISLSIGLGLSSYKLKAHFSFLKETVNGQTDIDNDTYNAICLYSNVEENISLLYLNLPILFSYGIPRSNKMSLYGKIGITPSFNISNSFEGSGNYNISGYYPEWNVLIHDVDALNFSSSSSTYKNVDYKINKFVLWGNISAGLYLPINGDSWMLKIGVKCDYSITPISKQLDEIFIKGATYRINQSNMLAGKGTRILSPGFEMSVIYILNK